MQNNVAVQVEEMLESPQVAGMVAAIVAPAAEKGRPDFVDDEHLEFLDTLRESGVTNMFGAGPYLQEEFGLTRRQASDVLLYWMRTFGEADR